MDRPIHYRPIVLTKLGERQALQDLTDEEHKKFTPVFVVPPRAWDFESETYSKSISAHLSKLPKDLATARREHDAYIDLQYLTDDLAPIEGEHPLNWLVTKAAERGLNLIPAIAVSSPDELVLAARDIAEHQGKGLALRLLPADWPSAVGIGRFIERLRLEPGMIDLVLDLGPDTGGPLVERALSSELARAQEQAWRSITLAGASWPKDNPGRGVSVLERSEWSTFKNLWRQAEGHLDYSDYGVSSFDPVLDVDPRMLNISASFRYTTFDSWLFAKGDLFKGNGGRSVGGQAVAPMLEDLRRHPLYGQTPRDKSNDWIDAVIDGTQGSGNATVWRRWGTFHHFKTVLAQLSSLNGS